MFDVHRAGANWVLQTSNCDVVLMSCKAVMAQTIADRENIIYIIKKVKKMPKIKTHSGAKKRFKLTGTGKIKRKHAFKSHILTKKSKKRKRNLTKTGLIHDSDTNNVKHMLGLK
jgi:large subunit ribosomal protein L35